MADAAMAIRKLLESEKYADLELRCRGKVLRVHCAIVCTRSSVLAAAVDGHFREATMRCIDLSSGELSILAAMIRYLYEGDYTAVETSSDSLRLGSQLGETGNKSEACQDEPKDLELVLESVLIKKNLPPIASFELLLHVKTYDIPALKALATKKYAAAVDSNLNWNTVAFSDSIEHLWNNIVDSDNLLRDVVILRANSHLEFLLYRGEFVELLRRHGDICVQLLQAKMRVSPAAEKHTGACGRQL